MRLAGIAVAAKSTTKDWIYRYYLFAKGFAEYRQGHFESAIAIMDSDAAKVMGPCPRFVKAMANYRLGHEQEARAMLAAEIAANDWRLSEARSHDQWIWHVLRREAESLIVPNLPAFLEGKYKPQDNDERLAMLGACQFKDRHAAMASLYFAAFTADPKLAEDLRAGHRYHAARAAAVAGCGGGADGPALSETERTHLRQQARQWLRLDLAARTKQLEAAKPADRDGLQNQLLHWRDDPGLAGLREPLALDKLPPAERPECRALWSDLDVRLGPAHVP